MAAPVITEPRKRLPSGRTRNNAERWSWIFMRASGVLLLVLIFTHLFINLITGDGVNQIDFAFVAGKWASPLWLAMLHGGNGMRLLINDYAGPRSRIVWQWVLWIAVVAIIVLGSLVIFTFDPCPVGADPNLLPDFCEDVR
jgi:succinate dehydrogenase / fumarate reductase membrane anchor subunit